MHDGCNARTFVHLALDPAGPADDVLLERPAGGLGPGTHALPRHAAAGARRHRSAQPDLRRVSHRTNDDPIVFETMHDVILRKAHARIAFHTWSGRRCFLPRGSVAATLSYPGRTLRLAGGDFLLLEEIAGASTGLTADADASPTRRPPDRGHARNRPNRCGRNPSSFSWAPADALPFPLLWGRHGRHAAASGHRGRCPRQHRARRPRPQPAADPQGGRRHRYPHRHPDPRSPRRHRLPLAPAALRRVADIRRRLRPGRNRHRRACAGPACRCGCPRPGQRGR